MADENNKDNPQEELRKYLEEHPEVGREDLEEVFKAAKAEIEGILKTSRPKTAPVVGGSFREFIYNRIFNPHRLYTLSDQGRKKTYITDLSNRIRGYPFPAYIVRVFENPESKPTCSFLDSEKFLVISDFISKIPSGMKACILEEELHWSYGEIPINQGGSYLVTESKNLTEEQAERLINHQECFIYLLEVAGYAPGREGNRIVCATNFENILYGCSFPQKLTGERVIPLFPFPKGEYGYFGLHIKPLHKRDWESSRDNRFRDSYNVLGVKIIEYGELFPVLARNKEPASLEKKLREVYFP